MILEDPKLVSKPIISVTILAYNHERYIRQCLDSILSQKVNVPWEVIIGEDCSKDNTREILKDYQKRYPERIRLVLHEMNQGLMKNYRCVKGLCRGEYIAQISGDDFWIDEYKLQKQYDVLQQHPDVDLCYTNTYTCDDNGVIEKRSMLQKEEVTFESHLFAAGYFAPLSWMFRKLVLSYVNLEPWFTDESFAVALDVLAKSKVYFINEPMTVYRCRMGSAASPIQTDAKWRYRLGILRMQLYYADKYKFTKDLLWKLKIQVYATNYMLAYEAGDEAFMKEAEAFFAESGLNMQAFIASGKEYVDYKMQFIGVKQSHAYNLGKKLLKPFKKLKG